MEDHINKCIVDVVGEEQLEENLDIKDLKFKKIEITKISDTCMHITVDGKMLYTLRNNIFEPAKLNFFKLIFRLTNIGIPCFT